VVVMDILKFYYLAFFAERAKVKSYVELRFIL
jgi:hypothetical protein